MKKKNETKEVVVAIASDLHAHEGSGDRAPSALCINLPESDPTVHPIAGLKKLIKEEGIKADYLLCPGDLGDKACQNGIKYAWDQLNQLKKSLKAKKLFATAGNHDVDSRLQSNGFDARGFLQTLSPLFPVDSQTKFDKYWSRHFAVLQDTKSTIVLLNSSAFHGIADEYEHGRISDHTLNALIAQLEGLKHKRALNILLCHHHPHPHEELDLGEGDLMKGGSGLLKKLSSGTTGEWMVIHGHKHHPKLSYAGGTTSVTPVVFAAGSLTASLYPKLQGAARNQFYVVTFPMDVFETHGLVGTFRSWDWIPDLGWKPAQQGSGLPHKGGFGCRIKPATAARDLAKKLKTPSVKWTEAVEAMDHLRYLMPDDLELTMRTLEDNHGYKALRDITGTLETLEKLA